MDPLKRDSQGTKQTDHENRIQALERRVINEGQSMCVATYGQSPSQQPFTGSAQTIDVAFTVFDTNDDETFPGLSGTGEKIWIARQGVYAVWNWFWASDFQEFTADRAAQTLFGSARIDTEAPSGAQPVYLIHSGAFGWNGTTNQGGRRESVGAAPSNPPNTYAFGTESQTFDQIMDFAMFNAFPPERPDPGDPQRLHYVSSQLHVFAGVASSTDLVNQCIVARLGDEMTLSPVFDPDEYVLP